MRYCNKLDTRNGSAAFGIEHLSKTHSSFEVAQYSKKKDCEYKANQRSASNYTSLHYNYSGYSPLDKLSDMRNHLQGCISAVIDSPSPPAHVHGDEIMQAEKGLNVERGNTRNSMKRKVAVLKAMDEFPREGSEIRTPMHRVMTPQSDYNDFRDSAEMKRIIGEKNDILRQQVDKCDGSSFGCPAERCDQDSTSHSGEEETLGSSDLSVNPRTPLAWVQSNKKMGLCLKLDLDKLQPFSLDKRHLRAEEMENARSLRCDSKSGIASDSYCVFLPRTYGVNMKLLRTTSVEKASQTTDVCDSLSWSMKDVRKDSELFSLAQLQPTLFDKTKKALEESLFQDVQLKLHGNSAGGTYIVHRLPSSLATNCNVFRDDLAQHTLSVFKPRDEEIGQRNNPHGNCRSHRVGFTPGSGSRREVLAYCLDHYHFAGIPPTLEVCAVHRLGPCCEKGGRAKSSMTTAPSAQVGSLQLFMPDCIDAADVLPGKFLIEEVHALAIFDIRTLNCDRHGGNVLVRYDVDKSGKSGVPHLVPIDHSYICPAGYEDPDYEWLSWPQSKVAFSKQSLAYIRNLDAAADADLVAAALTANTLAQTKASSPIQSSSLETVLNNSSTAIEQEISYLKDKQWVVEDLWVMSSPLCEDRFTPPASEVSSYQDTLECLKASKLSYGQHLAEDVRAAAHTLYCATRLLQVAALDFGFTACDIGNMCRRPRITRPSLLEELMDSSLDEATWETDRSMFELHLRKRLEAAAISQAESSISIPCSMGNRSQNL